MPSLRVLPLRMQLRRYRIAAGLTQGELATRTGISARTISDLERGLHGACGRTRWRSWPRRCS